MILVADGLHTFALIADVKIVGLWEKGRIALDFRLPDC